MDKKRAQKYFEVPTYEYGETFVMGGLDLDLKPKTKPKKKAAKREKIPAAEVKSQKTLTLR